MIGEEHVADYELGRREKPPADVKSGGKGALDRCTFDTVEQAEIDAAW